MSLQGAINAWNYEVEKVAEDLIERGVPPYEAISKAQEIVSENRANGPCRPNRRD